MTAQLTGQNPLAPQGYRGNFRILLAQLKGSRRARPAGSVGGGIRIVVRVFVLAFAVEITQEVGVIVRAEGARRARGCRAPCRRTDATALNRPDREVGRDPDQDHHQHELQHPSNVGGRWSPHTLNDVKEFVVYTALRIALFLASLGVVIGVWLLITDEVPLQWAVVVAFVISGIGSYFLLNRPRDAFARKVEARAARATARFDEMKAKEDAD